MLDLAFKSPMDYNKVSRTFCIEVSELPQVAMNDVMHNFGIGTTLRITHTGLEKSIRFICVDMDMDGSREDIYGYRFESLDAPNGPCNLLIIND